MAEKYLDFTPVPHGTKHEDGTPVLNRYSTFITKGHDFPGAQVGWKSCLGVTRECLCPRLILTDSIVFNRPCFMRRACQIESQ
jgi:hypothetical protein